jgi:16S rRNA (uracil1498-N3)-methyltransferase
MMQLFYCQNINSGPYILSREESRHCVRSLRLGEGDEIYLTDGMGGLYRALVIEPDPNKCTYTISGRVESEPAVSPQIHMAVALTKNMNRFEWFLEKATEVGVSEITPLICWKSERAVANMNRLQGILISAIKQSQRVWLPKLNDPEPFTSVIVKNTGSRGFIAWMGEGVGQQLKGACSKGENAVVLIGPEGDFTQEEVQQAIDHHYIPVLLGKYRLRTETAALVALQTIHFVNQ